MEKYAHNLIDTWVQDAYHVSSISSGGGMLYCTKMDRKTIEILQLRSASYCEVTALALRWTHYSLQSCRQMTDNLSYLKQTISNIVSWARSWLSSR
jgi:hypothetical protein